MSTPHVRPLLRGFIVLCVLMGVTDLLNAQDIPVTSQSDEAKTLFDEGRVLFDNLRVDEARNLFDEALQKDPNFAMANLYMALSANTDANFTKYLSKAVSAKSEVSDGERMLIESVKANHDNQPMQAISTLREAEERYPQDKHLHQFLGIAYQNTNQYDKTMDEYNKAIAIDASFAPPYNNLGYLYRDQGNYADAEKAFQQYINLLPQEANPHDSIADLYTKMGKYDQAIEHYQKALELNPKFYFSQQKIGDNLVFEGKYGEARTAYKKALEMAPDASSKILLQQNMANSWIYQDDTDKADQESNTAIKWAEDQSLPENAATIYQMKAFVNLDKGRLQQAQADLNACDKIMSSHNLTESRKHALKMAWLRNTAIKAAKEGNFDQAMSIADKLHEKAEASMNPNEMNMYNAVAGIIYYEQGKYDDAINKLKESDPNSPYAQFYLAESYQKMGKEKEAQMLFKKVAQWNENTLEYALVRNKAMTAAKMKLAEQ